MRFTASLLLTSSLAALGTAKSAFSSFKDPSLQVRQVSPSLTKYAISVSISAPVLTGYHSSAENGSQGGCPRRHPGLAVVRQEPEAFGISPDSPFLAGSAKRSGPSGSSTPALLYVETQGARCAGRYVLTPRVFFRHQSNRAYRYWRILARLRLGYYRHQRTVCAFLSFESPATAMLPTAGCDHNELDT